MNTLDSHRIEFPCPHCGGELVQTVGQIKTHTDVTCRHCGQVFDLDATQFKVEIAKAEQALTDFVRKLGRLSQ